MNIEYEIMFLTVIVAALFTVRFVVFNVTPVEMLLEFLMIVTMYFLFNSIKNIN
jgi:hypothetical protein